jgi:Winged helix-turn helix
MSIRVSLRGDFKASQLRALARKTKDGPQARRLLAAAIYDGATRTEAARIGGVTLQIIRDWVMRFNERGAAGLLDGKSPGQPSRLNDVQRQAIVRMIAVSARCRPRFRDDVARGDAGLFWLRYGPAFRLCEGGPGCRRRGLRCAMCAM